MIYLELISSTRDSGTLKSATTYKINASLTKTNLNRIQSLHHKEIKYQGKAPSILCAMGHRLQMEGPIIIFLAIQISNAVSQTLHSK